MLNKSKKSNNLGLEGDQIFFKSSKDHVQFQNLYVRVHSHIRGE